MNQEQGKKKSSKAVIIIFVLALLCAAGYAGAKYLITREVKERVEASLAGLRAKNMDVSYQDMSVNIFNRSTTFSDVTIKNNGENSHADQLVVRHSDDYARKADISLIGLEIKTDQFTPQARKVLNLGETGKCDSRLIYDLNPGTGDVDLQKFEVKMPHVLNLDMSCKLGNFPFKLALENPRVLLFGYQEITLGAFRLLLTDQGLVQSIIASQAAEKGKSVEDMKKEMAEQLSKSSEDLAKSGKTLEAMFAKAALNLLNNAKTLEIYTGMDKPVKLGDLAKADGEEAMVAELKLVVKN